MLKVTPQMATQRAESAVYDCLVSLFAEVLSVISHRPTRRDKTVASCRVVLGRRRELFPLCGRDFCVDDEADWSSSGPAIEYERYQ